MSPTELHGWGRTSRTRATLRSPADRDELRRLVTTAGPRGVMTRGLGRSYGDAAQNAGGTVVDLTGWDRILRLDRASITVESGISLDAVMRAIIPHGLWLPVIPGTRQITVGGAIAADVHGKNHHLRGSFMDHVTEIEVLLASGDVVTARPDGDHADLFWATAGGMGLTGVVLSATIALQRVESAFFLVDTDKLPHLDLLLEALASGDSAYEYSVAWFDTAASGRRLGRSVVTRGHHATLDDLPEDQRASALTMPDGPALGVPVPLPNGLVNRWTARAFNALWYAKAPAHREREVQSLTTFFHPLDLVADWNRVYGSRGFCQYQFVMPFGEEQALTTAVRDLAASGHVSSLNVLKRFGAGNRGPLSFPMAGWTLAVDLAATAGLERLFATLDDLVLAAGGRLYLAKDSRATADAVARMYPRLDEFRAVRDVVDPSRVFRSDLSRRLDL